MKFLSCFCVRKYQKCYKKFSYWLKVHFLWFQSMSFFHYCLTPIFFFWFENKGAQHFLIRVLVWILILKLSCVLHAVSLENDFWLTEYFELLFLNIAKIDVATMYLYLRPLWCVRLTGNSLYVNSHREKPVFITGNPCSHDRVPVIITGISL